MKIIFVVTLVIVGAIVAFVGYDMTRATDLVAQGIGVCAMIAGACGIVGGPITAIATT